MHYEFAPRGQTINNSTLRYECDETFYDECDYITHQEKVFRTSIVRNFISRGVKMRISAREACVKPHLRTRSDINSFFLFFFRNNIILIFSGVNTLRAYFYGH